METKKYYLTTADIQKLKSGQPISMITKDSEEILLIPSVSKRAKVWGYTYTFEIRFVGLMTKTQFIAEASKLASTNKNWIRDRISETYNTSEVAIAEAKPGQIIQVPN